MGVVFEVAEIITHLTDTQQLQALLAECDRLGTLTWVKVFCTMLQLRVTIVLCLCKSGRLAAE